MKTNIHYHKGHVRFRQMGHLLSWDRMHSAAQKRQTHMCLRKSCTWMHV